MDMRTKSTNSAIFPILFGFFVMGFVDVVGIATNYVKMDFGLSDNLGEPITHDGLSLVRPVLCPHRYLDGTARA